MKTTKRDLSAAQQTWRGRNDLICFSAAMLFMGAFFTFFVILAEFYFARWVFCASFRILSLPVWNCSVLSNWYRAYR